MNLIAITGITLVMFFQVIFAGGSSVRNKEQAILDGIAQRKKSAILDEQLRRKRLRDNYWHQVWVAANSLAIIMIAYMVYIFYIKG